MRKKNKSLFEQVITELECGHLESGTFDVYDPSHLVLFIEHMVNFGMDEQSAEDYLTRSLDEGKYPERQAYNKDGWLVTFPSKEYKDAAINKKTHFVSDPTHGKGGMNLYYKKKGKQQRQTSQVATSTQKTDLQQPLASVPKSPQLQPKKITQPAQPLQPEKTTQPEQPTTQQDQGQESTDDEEDLDFKSRDDELEQFITKKSGGKFNSKYSQPVASDQSIGAAPTLPDAPAINVPVVKPAPKDYVTLFKKFANQKGWTPTEYGEYRDREGNTVAVVGLSGEVVPIKNVDREEFKIFVEKNPM